MGCQCCRMIKSYIYDPSTMVEVGKSDAPGAGGSGGARGSLYQPQTAGVRGGDKQKEGISNLAYSKSNEGTLKLEADNNHVNQRLAMGVQQQAQLGAPVPTGGSSLYIIQPQAPGPRWNMDESQRPSLVPVYPDPLDYSSGGSGSPAPPAYRQSELARGWEVLSAANEDEDDEDEDDEGVGGTPDYTGDESESVLSVDIHTSTTSMSSTDTRDGGLRWAPPKTPDASTAESGISVMKSEDEEEEQEEQRTRRPVEEKEEEKGEEGGNDDVRSVTDSMVAEALAALEDATAGEDFE